MSLTDGLIQHFSPAGNAIGSGKIIFKDGAGAQYDRVGNNVTLVEDSFLGLSLGFSGRGSYLEIDHPELHQLEDFTIGGWFKFNNKAEWTRLIGKGNYGGGDESIGLWARPVANTWWFSQQGFVPEGRVASSEKEIAPDSWYHLTTVRQGDTLTLYYNTEVLGSQSGISGRATNPLPLRLGDNGEYEGFNGSMTHLRVYNRALSANEIGQMITASGVAFLAPAVTSGLSLDELPGAAFKRSHPVDFALFDQNNHYALYIDDSRAVGQPLTFEVHNTSDRKLVFQNSGESIASATNYHFELQFRPGVLSEGTLMRLREAGRKEEVVTDLSDWDVFVPAAGSADHVSLFILYRLFGDWPANTRRTLRFAGINADAGGGARGTQVAMLTNQLAFAGSEVPLTGQRTHHLSIINHRGEKKIPLHVGFIGSNDVLNVGGLETSLDLEIVNVLRRAHTHAETPFIVLSAGNARQPTSRLVLEFDVEQEVERSWALATASELDGMIVEVEVIRNGEPVADGSQGFHIVANTQSISRQWELTPGQDITLASGDAIRLHLSRIVSSLPNGPSNLYLHYDNIPGYQDGTFTLSVIKSPLLFAGGNVGIRTAAPAQTLDIAAGLRTSAHPAPATLALYTTADGQPAGGLAEFRHSNGTQGIGIGYNTIYATGANAAQDLNLASRGTGLVRLQGNTTVNGAVSIGASPYAAFNNFVANGALTVGSHTANYGGGNGWNGSTAGLLLECSTHTEIAVHDSGTRLSSLMLYQGDNINQITIGRNMGWGTTPVKMMDGLTIDKGGTNEGALTLTSSGPGWGSGLRLVNTAGPDGRAYGLYSSPSGTLHIADDSAGQDRITIDKDGTVFISGGLRVQGSLSKKFNRWWSMEIDNERDWGNTRVYIKTNASWSNSDARLKTEIRPIGNALDKVAQLNGITYKWNAEGKQHLTSHLENRVFAGPGATEAENRKARAEVREEAYRLLAGTEVGLLAQDVEKVLPELVRDGQDGMKEVRYDVLCALLVEAVKELRSKMEE